MIMSTKIIRGCYDDDLTGVKPSVTLLLCSNSSPPLLSPIALDVTYELLKDSSDDHFNKEKSSLFTELCGAKNLPFRNMYFT